MCSLAGKPYALKQMSKAHIIDNKLVAHVHREKNVSDALCLVLLLCSCPVQIYIDKPYMAVQLALQATVQVASFLEGLNCTAF